MALRVAEVLVVARAVAGEEVDSPVPAAKATV
jgi:hypothetical protein